jgi:site-specific recombinase XerD
MRDAALVAVATGMREEELFTLTASQVALLQCNGHLVKTKSGKPRNVPFNDDALSVLARRMEGKKGGRIEHQAFSTAVACLQLSQHVASPPR